MSKTMFTVKTKTMMMWDVVEIAVLQDYLPDKMILNE
jgi:hypothetical protein